MSFERERINGNIFIIKYSGKMNELQKQGNERMISNLNLNFKKVPFLHILANTYLLTF